MLANQFMIYIQIKVPLILIGLALHLIEIVSEPEMANADEAVQYLKNIHSLVQYLEISDGNMQEGSFRCDANISLKKKDSDHIGHKGGNKKYKFLSNMWKVLLIMKFKDKSEILNRGDKVIQETRLYDPSKR